MKRAVRPSERRLSKMKIYLVVVEEINYEACDDEPNKKTERIIGSPDIAFDTFDEAQMYADKENQELSREGTRSFIYQVVEIELVQEKDIK